MEDIEKGCTSTPQTANQNISKDSDYQDNNQTFDEEFEAELCASDFAQEAVSREQRYSCNAEMYLSPDEWERRQREEKEELHRGASNVVGDVLSKIDLHEESTLPIWGLPTWAQELINEITGVRQCPREFPTTALFSAICTLVGGNVKIIGKYTNSLCLWLVNVAPSGSNKSQPSKDIFAPINSIDAEEYKAYSAAMREWEEIKDNPEPKPKYRQIVFSDVTPEARNKLLGDNPRGATLCRDEIAGMVKDFGRYSKSGEVAQMLSIFDNDTIRVNRKSDEPLRIENPYMPIFGSIQPDILADTFSNPDFLGSGFTQRFLFCFPDDVAFPEYSDRALRPDIMKLWGDVARQMYNYHPQEIRLSSQAEEVYRDYYNTMQSAKEEATERTRAFLSKFQIIVLRLGGIVRAMHHVEEVQGEDAISYISGEEMRYAVECIRYFQHTAEKVISLCGQDTKKLSVDDHVRAIARSGIIVNDTQFAESIGTNRMKIWRMKTEK